MIKNHLTFVLLAGLSFGASEPFTHATTASWQLSSVAIGPVQPDPPPATLVIRGTIKSYDPTSKILLLSTPNGTMQLSIPPAVRIRQHWHNIDASVLVTSAGLHAAVRYSESGATKTVQSVHVFGKDERAR